MKSTWDIWVARDGSYGTSEIGFFDTSKWSEDDWRDFDEAPDHEKLTVANLNMIGKDD